MYSIEVILHFRSSKFSSICDTASEAMDAVRGTYEAITGRTMTYEECDEWMKRLVSIRYGRMTETEMMGIAARRARE